MCLDCDDELKKVQGKRYDRIDEIIELDHKQSLYLVINIRILNSIEKYHLPN